MDIICTLKMLLRNVFSNSVAFKQNQRELHPSSGLVQELQSLWASGPFTSLVHSCAYPILNFPSRVSFPPNRFAFPDFHLEDLSWPWLAITVTTMTSPTFGSGWSGQHLSSSYPPALASQGFIHPINPPSAKSAPALLDWVSEKLVVQPKGLK